MRKTWSWLGGGVFALVVAGALGFGATQALASTARADDCTAWYQVDVGTCPTDDCFEACGSIGLTDGGICRNGCCTCAY